MQSIQEANCNPLKNQVSPKESPKSRMICEKNINSFPENVSNFEQKETFPTQKKSLNHNSSPFNYKQKEKTNFQIKQNYIENKEKENFLSSSIVSYFYESQKFLSEQYEEEFLLNKKENKIVYNLNHQNEFGKDNHNQYNDNLNNFELYYNRVKNKNFIFKGNKKENETTNKNEENSNNNFILNKSKNNNNITKNSNNSIIVKNSNQIQNNKIYNDSLLNNQVINNKININFSKINDSYKNKIPQKPNHDFDQNFQQNKLNNQIIQNFDNISQIKNLNNIANNQNFQFIHNLNQNQNNFNKNTSNNLSKFNKSNTLKNLNINHNISLSFENNKPQTQISSENEKKNYNPDMSTNKENSTLENFGKSYWQCEKCNYFNFDKRTKCKGCGETMKPKIIIQKKNEDNKNKTNKKKVLVKRNGDWICQKCKNLNFSFRTICNRCKLPKQNPVKIVNNERNLDNNNINLLNFIFKLYPNNLYNSNVNTNTQNITNLLLNILNKAKLENNNNVTLINQMLQFINLNKINNQNLAVLNQVFNNNINNLTQINNLGNFQININNNYFYNNSCKENIKDYVEKSIYNNFCNFSNFIIGNNAAQQIKNRNSEV